MPASVVWTENYRRHAATRDVDIVVELMGGLDPGGGLAAQGAGCGQVGGDGEQAADRLSRREPCEAGGGAGVHLLHGAAVAGGVPVIPGMLQGLGGDQMTRVSGIVNGTCNYILSRMEAGCGLCDGAGGCAGAGLCGGGSVGGCGRLRCARQALHPVAHCDACGA